MTEAPRAPRIFVLAGVNGAGKSSIAGAMMRAEGADYFNPDEAANRMLAANPRLTSAEANSMAWHEGKRLLERAISERCDFAFESTLGGDTIGRLLELATKAGIELWIWYVGLDGPELHLARIRARVAGGGHDIPESVVRRRYDRSRLNLIRLVRVATEVRVFDNTADGDPRSGARPILRRILHVRRGRVIEVCEASAVPDWAKPVVAAAMIGRP